MHRVTCGYGVMVVVQGELFVGDGRRVVSAL
jgi:hypothetical protein